MLSVGQLNEGFVLDHIQAGKSMEIYRYLKLDKLDCCVAIIKNARSDKMGKQGYHQSGVLSARCWIWMFWASSTTTSP